MIHTVLRACQKNDSNGKETASTASACGGGGLSPPVDKVVKLLPWKRVDKYHIKY
jgi:hypothetical protein